MTKQLYHTICETIADRKEKLDDLLISEEKQWFYLGEINALQGVLESSKPD